MGKVPASTSKGCPYHQGIEVSHAGTDHFRDLLEAAPDPMVIVNTLGVMTLVNSQMEKLFGFTREELVGQPIEILLPQRFRERHIAHRENYNGAPKVRGMGIGMELCGARKDGTEFPVEISLNPIKTEEGLFVVSAIRDTTDRRAIEKKLRDSLREKEVLLKEVHHRVKNNLQVISSLLNFQSEFITDPAARDAFQDTRSRIKSIALIHERLYQSEDLSHINFRDYVAGLMADLYDSYGIDNTRVELSIEIDFVSLDVDAVVNCGLIVNELVSNALKYAFPDSRCGTIHVSLRKCASDTLELAVSDDGVGLPEGDSFLMKPTLGLKLVRGLAKELGSSLQVSRKPLTRFVVTFSSEHNDSSGRSEK